ncbi:MAG: DUF2254 domain-containing protein [Candidatus Eremiobacteraeota bacterium]|nr:DUF2254 domain-containing protein [Candidatus Eremiobacteraeota bacterium]
MIARGRNLLTAIGDAFWLLPGLMVTAGVVAAVLLVEADRSGAVPQALLKSPWLYNGGSTGARTLLGAIASSTIGVAGTVFSITIAALSLAAGQMGPRLLRNFTRDRWVQMSLGTFLGTFSYALMVLRTVRDRGESVFVPHLALSVAILLALVCVGTLIYFIDHMASRINVDTVVELVSDDLRFAFARLTTESAQPARPSAAQWQQATSVFDGRRGYLQQLEGDALADWASKNGTSVSLAVRLGDYVFPGAPIALMTPHARGGSAAIMDATALGAQRASSGDLEFAVRQLVEVAVRALSPGINDPMTAISVLDRLGSALCDLAPRQLHTGVYERDGRIVLVVPSIDYDGLVDAMFHMIRQNADGSAAVLIRMVDVIVAVARCERDPGRIETLARHVTLVRHDAMRAIPSAADRDDIIARCEIFAAVRNEGPAAALASQRD